MGTKCAVLAPGFAEPAAALSVRGLLAMQQVLTDVVSNSLPADIQVDFILLQGICSDTNKGCHTNHPEECLSILSHEE